MHFPSKIKYLITLFLLKVLSVLPLTWCRIIERFFGRLLMPYDIRTNKVIERNLSICLPQLSKQERTSLRNKRLENIGQTLFEFAHVFVKSKGRVCGYCNQLPQTHGFVRSCASDDGVIVLVPHIGNWEVMNFFLSQYRKRTILYRPMKNQS